MPKIKTSKILLIGGAGYIGTHIYLRLKDNGHNVNVCDVGWRGYPHGAVTHACNYTALSKENLAPYSTVLWFGGHSSVGAATKDPQGALHNNCLDLVALREKMQPAARLIYASSASLYSAPINQRGQPLLGAIETQDLIVNINSYDISKFTFDYIAKGFLKNFIGLRLGTVSGWSPNLRAELLFNAMNLSALRDGVVRVANPSASRSIVFLDDLYKVVSACVDKTELDDGFFNIASATRTIGEFAEMIAGFYGARIEMLPNSPTYSFRLNTNHAQRVLGVTFDDDITRRCQEFSEALKEKAA